MRPGPPRRRGGVPPPSSGPSHRYKLVNRRSGKVLGADSASTADGAQVVQWKDTGAPDQQWSLVPVS
nr:RICIN domain-containing protein [Streptomyces sp. A0642]